MTRIKPRLRSHLGVCSAWLVAGITTPLPATASAQQAIIGGTSSPDDRAVVRVDRAGAPHCTGTLITPETVLTAAHCAVADEETGTLTIKWGADLLSERAVASQHVHPQWDPKDGRHDLLLLRLAAPVFDITPATLYPCALSTEDIGRTMRVVGYGVQSPTARLTVLERRQVELKVRNVFLFQIEAGAPGKQACHGDSGAPGYMRVPGQAEETIATVVSRGDASCSNTAFYARVDNDRPWIRSTTSTWSARPLIETPALCPQQEPALTDAGTQSCASMGVVLLFGVRLFRPRPSSSRRCRRRDSPKTP